MRSFKINENIIKYTFGDPLETESVIKNKGEEIKEDLKYLTLEEEGFTFGLKKEDIIYGLGENVGGINKRGRIFESFCTDDFSHTPEKKSLYGAHNFFVVHGEKTFGVFLDFGGKVIFDLGFNDKDKLKIKVSENDFNLYIIDGDNILDIVKNFRDIIGMSYVAPKWALGVGQSRWGYKNEEDIRNVLSRYEKEEMPLDMIYLDIDYMKDFKNFTVDRERFKDFEGFVKEFKEKGIRLIPIIDAGCKIERGYDVYEEGIKNNFYCNDENGDPFVAAVWPGLVHFPDFLNKDARRWFGLKYKFLTDKGIEGFWNDMNEPAIFYSEKRLKEAFNYIDSFKDKNIGIYDYFDLSSSFDKLKNSIEDYKSFYHNIDGNLIRHDRVHNLFGFNMTRSASEGLKEIDENKRFLLFSRASTVGMHRYGGIWTGDNASWFEHIKLNLQMMPGINMCGFIFTGADTGGFGSDANEELVIRWSALSLFTPLFRNHAALGTRNQEPYSFSKEGRETLKNILDLRYALIPHLYSEYMKSILNNDMYFKPLAFEYNDDFSKRVEDQLLLGDSLMIAPVYEENAKGRYVYIPEDMLLLKANSLENIEFEVCKKGVSYMDLELNEVPIFIRKNKMLVINNSNAKRVEEIDEDTLDVFAFVDKKANYTYYNDDGITNDFKEGKFEKIDIVIEKDKENYKIETKSIGLKKEKKLNLTIFNLDGSRVEKKITIS